MWLHNHFLGLTTEKMAEPPRSWPLTFSDFDVILYGYACVASNNNGNFSSKAQTN